MFTCFLWRISHKYCAGESLGYVFAKQKRCQKYTSKNVGNIKRKHSFTHFLGRKKEYLSQLFSIKVVWDTFQKISSRLCLKFVQGYTPQIFLSFFFGRTSPAHFPPQILWGTYPKKSGSHAPGMVLFWDMNPKIMPNTHLTRYHPKHSFKHIPQQI